MRETIDKPVWGVVDKVGKGTKATYEPSKKTLTFCFKRGPETSSEQLRAQRELLLKELKELGYVGRMKYNGEVLVENVAGENVTLVNKNHKLVIHLTDLTKKPDEEKGASEQT